MVAQLPRLHVRLGGREVSAFRLCGVVGLAGAAGLAGALAAILGASLAVQGLIVGAAVLTFFALAMATKVVTGREALIYYHHEVAVLTVAMAVAAVVGAPVLRHLDATALGLGVFLACGRVGCLMVGCCHGRPAPRRGVRYGHAHAGEGFPLHLVGVPLLPVQAVESVAVAGLVAVGVAAVLAGAAPGTGLVVYVTGYAVLRFGLELLRGDEGRRSAAGLTEAQWTSLALLAVMAAAGALGWVPAGGAAEAAALALCFAVLLPLAIIDARAPSRRVRHPAHVRELAEALDGSLVRTSEGVLVSSGHDAGVAHYTLSGAAAPVAAELVRRLRHPAAAARIVPGRGEIAHLVVAQPHGTG
jgi:prolipoprotein diacylglyceryltransferase